MKLATAVPTRGTPLTPLTPQADPPLASQLSQLHATYRQAAHDLRAPLNAIALNLEILGQDVADEAGGRAARRSALERVELLRLEVARLSRLLHALLDPSAVPRREPGSVGLRRLLREVVELVAAPAARLGIRISMTLPKERVAVRAPRDHLKQALLNLLVNALEAMPRGGPLEIDLCSDGERSVIRIRDHGVGIAARHRDQLFTPDFTTKPGGSGIGLFTARAAIEAMGGTLTLHGTEGIGATARIELPVAEPDPAPEGACSTS